MSDSGVGGVGGMGGGGGAELEASSPLSTSSTTGGDSEYTFPVALIVVLWVSALSSSFVDNIPFTQAMIPIVYQLGESDDNLFVHPLIWALAMGACLGGNGTLIGASANLVCAATAQQKGYKITFNTFFKTGFPFMLITTLAASFYLIFFMFTHFNGTFYQTTTQTTIDNQRLCFLKIENTKQHFCLIDGDLYKFIEFLYSGYFVIFKKNV